MKEIRLHGRGGQGVVKAAQTVVKAVVDQQGYAHFIPFFGVERKGSPVYGFLRIAEEDIRLKTQVYTPELLLIFDDTLLDLPQTFEGLVEGGAVIINTKKACSDLSLPKAVGTVATVDATGISIDVIGRNIPNTAMLGAFCKVTGWADWDSLKKYIGQAFGEKNIKAAETAYEKVAVTQPA